jgi:hypothetical protein
MFSNIKAFSEYINFKGGLISSRHFHLRPDPQKKSSKLVSSHMDQIRNTFLN